MQTTPTAAAPTITSTSAKELLDVYAPSARSSSRNGTRSGPETNVRRVSGFRSRNAATTATALASTVTQIIEKVTSREVVSISCPGFRPTMRNADSSTALPAPPGMPNPIVGMSDPLSLALFTAPAAMTPSIDPLPNISGFFELCCAAP
jgi:hypothetical protein